jgi:hypothetical protein
VGPAGAVKLKVGLKRMAAGGGGFCKSPVWCYSGTVLMYTVLEVVNIRRPIETNIFFRVGRCIKKNALAEAKRSRVTQRTEACPIIPRMKPEEITPAGRSTPQCPKNIFAPRSRRILRTSALASVRNPQGKRSLCSYSTGREGRVVWLSYAIGQYCVN